VHVVIDSPQGLDAHAEEVAGVLQRDAALDQPRRRCVTECVGRYPVKKRVLASSLKSLLNSGSNRSRVELDSMALAVLMPAAKVSDEPGGELDGRLSLVGLSLSGGSTVKHTSFKINPSCVGRGSESRRTYRPGASASVESNEHKPRHVLPALSSCCMALLHLLVSPRRPDQAGGFGSGEPSRTRFPAVGENDVNNLPAKSLTSMVADSGA
jgi:hypothetical protein